MEGKAKLIKKILEEELALVKGYGVDHLGYRCFLPDGSSFGCTTVDEWYSVIRDEAFHSHQKKYLWEELKHLHDKNFSYVTRSADHEESEYLKSLKQFKLDNSTGIYKFGPEKIDSVFFIYNKEFGERRDFILNKMPELEHHVNSIVWKINKVLYYIQKDVAPDFRFDRNKCKELFVKYKGSRKIHLDGGINILFKGRSVDLTERDIEVMRMLALGVEYSHIAEKFSVSVKRVQFYATSLKKKFLAQSKGELIHMLNTPQIQRILQQR